MAQTNDIAIDLGTSNVVIYMKGRGIVFREPSDKRHASVFCYFSCRQTADCQAQSCYGCTDRRQGYGEESTDQFHV